MAPFQQMRNTTLAPRDARCQQNPAEVAQGNFEPRLRQFRKTKLCRFKETGNCRYVEKCPFAHSLEELEELPDLTKTSICKSWQHGACMMSPDMCPFAHGKEHLRKTQPLPLSNKKAFKQEAEGSETTTGFQSDDSTSVSGRESGRHSFSSAVDDATSTPRGQLSWDPLGLDEQAWPSSPELYVPRFAGKTRMKNKKNRDAQLSKSGWIDNMPGMACNMNPMLNGMMCNSGLPFNPLQYILVPASTVMWDMPRVQPSFRNQNIEEMLRQAQPDHYED